jgi:hypothetical protein
MTEAEIRVVVRELASLHQPAAMVLEEVCVGYGVARIDVLGVGDENGCLHGYEIKSAADTLSRLRVQVPAFSLVFDRVTLCVAPKHVKSALAKSPPWWGVDAVGPASAERYGARTIRAGAVNPDSVVSWQLQLLWREELEEFALSWDGRFPGLGRLSKRGIAASLMETYSPDYVRAAVRTYLRNRPDWWKRREPKPEAA